MLLSPAVPHYRRSAGAGAPAAQGFAPESPLTCDLDLPNGNRIGPGESHSSKQFRPNDRLSRPRDIWA
jgi:hypothetical protein